MGIVHGIDTLQNKASCGSEQLSQEILNGCADKSQPTTTEQCQVDWGPVWDGPALGRAIALYDAWGKPEQAAAWRLKRLDFDFPDDPFGAEDHALHTGIGVSAATLTDASERFQ